jgi:hypothetical protein
LISHGLTTANGLNNLNAIAFIQLAISMLTTGHKLIIHFDGNAFAGEL